MSRKKYKYKQKTNAQKKSTKCEIYIRSCIQNKGWTYHPYHNDVPFDSSIQLISGSDVRGKYINIQEKTTNELRELKKSKDILSFTVDVSFLSSAIDSNSPALIVVYSEENKEGYWLWLHEYVYNLELKENPDWYKQKYLTLKINKNYIFGKDLDIIEKLFLEGPNRIFLWRYYLRKNVPTFEDVKLTMRASGSIESTDDPELIDMYNESADAFQKEDYNLSISSLLNAIQKYPKFYEAMNLLSLCYLLTNKLFDALDTIDDAYKIKPDNLSIMNNYGVILNKTGRNNEALEYYFKYFEKEENFVVCNNIGNVYRDLKDFENALKWYRKALKFEPKNWDTKFNLYLVKVESGKVDRVDEIPILFLKDIPKGKKNFNVYWLIGLYYRQLIKKYWKDIEVGFWFEKAKAHFQRAIELNPDHAKILLHFGTLYYDFKFYEEALDKYNKALEINPNYILAIGNKANIYRERGDYIDALSMYNKIIEITPKDHLAFYNRGKLYLEIDKLEEAEKDFYMAFKINPDDLRLLNDLYNIYLSKGMKEESDRILERINKIDPNFIQRIKEKSRKVSK